LALILLGTVAVAGELAQSSAAWHKLHRLWTGDHPEIEVISATYGMNCKDFVVQPQFRNTVSPGNATVAIRRACDWQQQCSPVINLSMSGGDPANSCGKDFSVEYKCYGSDSVRKAYIPGEALGKPLSLQCGIAPPP
jgi:hypothetical protein